MLSTFSLAGDPFSCSPPNQISLRIKVSSRKFPDSFPKFILPSQVPLAQVGWYLLCTCIPFCPVWWLAVFMSILLEFKLLKGKKDLVFIGIFLLFLPPRTVLSM